MIINSFKPINNVFSSYKKNNNNSNLNSLNQDVFVKSFKSNENSCADDMSYAGFINWTERNGFLGNIKDNLSSLSYLGSGFEGTTYAIPKCDNWIIKQYKNGHFCPHPTKAPEIKEIPDLSPHINVGQPIAQLYVPINDYYSSLYWILKKQTGNEYGVDFTHAKSIDTYNEKIHLNSLKTLASMPQTSYDRCIEDIKYITQLGYALDYHNPNNIMLDTKTNIINFVDVNDKHEGRKEQFAEGLYSLLDANFAIKYNAESSNPEGKKEAKELSDIIISKYFQAMKNNNQKFDDKGYSIISEILNNYFGVSSKEEEYKMLQENGLL